MGKMWWIARWQKSTQMEDVRCKGTISMDDPVVCGYGSLEVVERAVPVSLLKKRGHDEAARYIDRTIRDHRTLSRLPKLSTRAKRHHVVICSR